MLWSYLLHGSLDQWKVILFIHHSKRSLLELATWVVPFSLECRFLLHLVDHQFNMLLVARVKFRVTFISSNLLPTLKYV